MKFLLAAATLLSLGAVWFAARHSVPAGLGVVCVVTRNADGHLHFDRNMSAVLTKNAGVLVETSAAACRRDVGDVRQ